MNKFKVTAYSISILICILLVTYALCVFPIPGTDSAVFVPAAFLYSKGYGLANPLYYVTRYTDFTHTNRFNYYVPFYPFFLGLLSKIKPGVKTIFFICALFSSTGLLLYARTVLSFFSGRVPALFRALIIVSFTYIATYLLPTVGRPENFTCLFVMLAYLLYSRRNSVSKQLYFALFALLFALMFATQLLCFFFCFLFYNIYEVANSGQVYKTILKNFLLFLCTAALFCIILAITPNGLVSTAEGTMLHIRGVMLNRSDRGFSSFVHYWVLAPLNFGFLFVFLAGAGCFLAEISVKIRQAEPVKKTLVILMVLVAAFGIYKFILYASPTVYNATEFILPLSAYIIYSISHVHKNMFAKGASAVMLLTCIAGSFIFLRTLLLFVDTERNGTTYNKAKEQILPLVAHNKRFLISNGFWALFDSYDHLELFEQNYQQGDTVVMQQAYHPLSAEQFSQRFTPIYDHRRMPEEVKFMGLQLSNRPNDYSFVICSIR